MYMYIYIYIYIYVYIYNPPMLPPRALATATLRYRTSRPPC